MQHSRTLRLLNMCSSMLQQELNVPAAAAVVEAWDDAFATATASNSRKTTAMLHTTFMLLGPGTSARHANWHHSQQRC